MEPITRSLCPECDSCPEVIMDLAGVTIGEPGNTVRLSHAEWNRLVALIQSGELRPAE